MSKVYNKNLNISSPISQVYSNLINNFISSSSFMPLPFLKFIPILLISMIESESIILSDLASSIAPLLNISIDSSERKIRRFIQNNNYDFNYFYQFFIQSIISNFKIKHPDNNVQIIFDHMYVQKKFTVFMFSLRIGKAGIPIWFQTFDYHSNHAFQFDVLTNGINYCHNLLKSSNPNCNITFLADRFWGNHVKLFQLINLLGDNYFIRSKGDLLVLAYDKKEKHDLYKHLSKLNSYLYHSNLLYDIPITRKHYKVNIAISKSKGHVEPYYIITNTNPKRAIKDYSKRFGGIEFIFKAQKSNGFFLEETQIKDIYSFNSLYTCICIAQVLTTILGVDYSKNGKCYKEIKIRTTKIVKGKRIRIYSYFHVGIIIVKYVLKSIHSLNIFKRLILYDI